MKRQYEKNQSTVDSCMLMFIEDILEEYEEKNEELKNNLTSYTKNDYDILLEYLLDDIYEDGILDDINKKIKEIINVRLNIK